MKNFEIQFIAGSVLFLTTIFAGYWLSKQGVPFKTIPFNSHKFISLGSIALIGMAFIKYYKITGNPTIMLIIGIPTLIFVLTALISGGIMSHQNINEGLVLKLHQISTLGTLVSLITMVIVYIRS